jgi:hypothetical protein
MVATINRSALLKKYEMAYETCVKKSMKKSPKTKARKPSKVNDCLEKTKKAMIKKMKSLSPIKFKSKKIQQEFIKSIKTKLKKSLKTKKLKSKVKKSLNLYQKFVKDQSKKSGIKNLSPEKRFKQISKLWKKYKNKL